MMNKYEWFNCPRCGKRLFKIKKDSIIKGIKVWCKTCKEEKEIYLEPKSLQNK